MRTDDIINVVNLTDGADINKSQLKDPFYVVLYIEDGSMSMVYAANRYQLDIVMNVDDGM